jgi:hypothetical protein
MHVRFFWIGPITHTFAFDYLREFRAASVAEQSGGDTRAGAATGGGLMLPGFGAGCEEPPA